MAPLKPYYMHYHAPIFKTFDGKTHKKFVRYQLREAGQL